MNPLKKFQEWYEARHRIWKGILWIVGIILAFSVWTVLFATWYYYSGTPIALLAAITFSIIGFITIFIIYKSSEKQTGILRYVLNFFWVFPGLFWIVASIMFIIFYWQAFLILIVSSSTTYITWKLRKREARAKLAEYASWAFKITYFFGTGTVVVFILSGLTGVPLRNFFVQLGLGMLLVIIVVVIIVIFVAAPETGLEGLASGGQSLLSGETVVDGGFMQFLGECCQGLLIWLLIGGVAFATWKLGQVIWQLKRRGEAVAWELEDQLKELNERLAAGAISQKKYEQEKRKLLEKSKA